MSGRSSPTEPDRRERRDASDRRPAGDDLGGEMEGGAAERRRAAGGRRFLFLTALPGWLVSVILHMLALLLLALISLAPPVEQLRAVLTVLERRDDQPMEEFHPAAVRPMEASRLESQPMLDVPAEPQLAAPDIQLSSEPDAVSVPLNLDFSERTAPKENLLKEIGSVTAAGLSGRGAEHRGEMLEKGGGNEASEAAVAAALAWLAEHQLSDGGWSFDHRRAASCRGRCSDPGLAWRARNAATGLALLPFLGAGHTHQEGEYRETVRRGLYYLTANMKVRGQRGDLSEPEAGGFMYSHGIASIALCEAYAMTRDGELVKPAQLAINYIVYAQDPVGGGWRYFPKDRGDTSMVGWQLMALKSGVMAYLKVPRATFAGASKFLDSVQSNYGAVYGYKRPGDRGADGDFTTTAIGLLCRMYLGWPKDHEGIQRGVQLLSQAGPSKDNMYYNYYATQVMHHWGGELWDSWNRVMRDYLVKNQSQKGHMAGSWYFPGELLIGDRGTLPGGRLYFTSLSAMILEVYYRHMPIYSQRALDDDFPL